MISVINKETCQQFPKKQSLSHWSRLYSSAEMGNATHHR